MFGIHFRRPSPFETLVQPTSGQRQGALPSLKTFQQDHKGFAVAMEQYYRGDMAALHSFLSSWSSEELGAVLNNSRALQSYLGLDNPVRTTFASPSPRIQTGEPSALVQAATLLHSESQSGRALSRLQDLLQEAGRVPGNDDEFRASFKEAIEGLATNLHRIPGERNRLLAETIINNNNFRMGEDAGSIREKLNASRQNLASIRQEVTTQAQRARRRWATQQSRQGHVAEMASPYGGMAGPRLRDLHNAGWTDTQTAALKNRFNAMHSRDPQVRREAIHEFNSVYVKHFGFADPQSVARLQPLIEAIHQDQLAKAPPQALTNHLRTNGWEEVHLAALKRAIDDCLAATTPKGRFSMGHVKRATAAIDQFNAVYGDSCGKVDTSPSSMKRLANLSAVLGREQADEAARRATEIFNTLKANPNWQDHHRRTLAYEIDRCVDSARAHGGKQSSFDAVSMQFNHLYGNPREPSRACSRCIELW